MYSPNGLGFWQPIAAQVGSALVSNWFGGDGDVPNDVYYPDAKAGIVHCPGPWNVESVAEALEHIAPSDPLGIEAREYFRTGVAGRDAEKWARYGVPSSPLGLAGALVAEAHGGSDCQTGAPATAATVLIRRILAHEEDRRARLAAAIQSAELAAQQVATVATTPVLTSVVPGGVSPLAIAGAALTLAMFMRRR